jgi:polysaccharide export outer membrane protein
MKRIAKLAIWTILFTPAIASHGKEPKLIPGATISVRLAGVPADEAVQVTGMYLISSNGILRLPHLDAELQAAGLEPSQLQTKIITAYKTAGIYTNPSITVLSGPNENPSVITVGGEVRTPRSVHFRPGINLYGAITDAGGANEYSDLSKVRLLRAGKERVLDLRKITPENNIELQAGDQIVVPGG